MSDSNITTDDKKHASERSISYNDIASKLINDRLLLTALELHTELIEAGKELRVLRDFFSNPANFELQSQEVSLISRSGSQATLDSLDLTRYSEDGERGTDDRVAVLEFELRKAKETISALRNNLTVATESETSSPDKGSLKQLNSEAIKPHEQRALNFLINEYLLMHGYKLTSITFADENENQDFEDWDDVGLNIAKPLELLQLYREGLKRTGCDSVFAVTQTDFVLKDEKAEEKIAQLSVEVTALKSEIEHLQNQLSDINSGTQNEDVSSQKIDKTALIEDAMKELPKNVTSSKNSTTGSNSPECFEIIDRNSISAKKRDSIITLEDNISNNSFNTNEWTSIGVNANEHFDKESTEISPKERSPALPNSLEFNDLLTEAFSKEIFSLCYVNLPNRVDNEILENILNDTINSENLVHTLSRSLLRIIPNVILNKREEVIPLLISAVHLNPNISERDKLLQQLFNLKKKPSEVERVMILTGIVGIAKNSGKSMVENEILPQCWEQLTHKHPERRLLVAESCTALIPYISSPIRNSLVLSMLQQMLDDKEEGVKEAVVRALALVVTFCDDVDKYAQCEELALLTLNETSVKVVSISILVLFPALAKWALDIGRLQSDLIKNLLQKLNESLKDVEASGRNLDPDKVLRIIKVLEHLLPFVLMFCAANESVLERIDRDMAMELRSELLKLCSNVTNPKYFYKSECNVGMILYEFDKLIVENPKVTWQELDWITDIVLPDLLNNLNHVEISNRTLLKSFISLFSHICILFGKNFTKGKIRPFFLSHVQCLEQILSSFNQYCPSLNIIPVYLVSVLSYCGEVEEIGNVLKSFLCALPLCGIPLDCLEVTVKELCELKMHDVVVTCLWEAVVHQRPLVRSAAAALFSSILGLCSENLLTTKVTPAIVTLASDNDVLVRTATIPTLGSLITDCNIQAVHDKAYMQIQTYIADTSLRDNHTLLRQLVVTLGSIASSCSLQFRQDVILPQLTALSMYMSQMTNQTRKVDMALALIEAFSNVIFSPVNKQSFSSVLIPGLRCLESVVIDNQSLATHRDTVTSMIKECDNREHQAVNLQADKSQNKLAQNMNQGVEDMRQRVSKIFNKPSGMKQSNTFHNLPGLFKKK